MYKRIIVPLDGSPLAEQILSHVNVIAQRFESEIIFLYVIPTPVPEFATPSLKPFKDSLQEQRRAPTRYLKSVSAKVEQEGIRTSYLIREGAVAETILEVAEFMQADMIAMSTQGRSGAQLLLLGSVTYQVVRHSPLPVLIIRSTP
jgi:nucleotide-binding universal stress UspA family protein